MLSPPPPKWHFPRRVQVATQDLSCSAQQHTAILTKMEKIPKYLAGKAAERDGERLF